MTGSEIVMLVAVVVLIVAAAFLAMAETSLTRTNRVKALTLVEEKHRALARQRARPAAQDPLLPARQAGLTE